ncbi:MAG: c-type cytochrome domain-containing protein [Phycisphaerae bacterium]
MSTCNWLPNDLAAANWVLFFGHFHILLLHLPIGMLLLLAALELLGRFNRFKRVREARGPALTLAALSALATVVCGWLLASAGGYNATLLFWHRWLGTTVAALCCAAWLAWRFNRLIVYQCGLWAAVAVLLVAAHLGGSLTHGSGYLTEYAPRFIRRFMGNAPRNQTARQIVSDPERLVVYRDIISPIFTTDCITCHGPDKQKAGLRLDTFAALMKGSHDGPVIAVGEPDHSVLVQRLLLRAGDRHRMPPAGKPGPTNDQIALIRWWVRSGAKPLATVAQLPQTSGIADILDKLYPSPDALKPLPRAQALALATKIAAQEHVVIRPETATSKWLDCNANLHKSFSDAQVAQLLPLAANLRSLNLGRTLVSDAAMAAVGKMTNLHRLSLNSTAITDAGLKKLRHLRRLSYLNLYDTKVSDASLTYLRQMPRLRHVYLWHTSVTTAAAGQFSRMMTDTDQINRWDAQIARLQRHIADAQVQALLGAGPSGAKVAVAAPAAKPINMFCPNSGRPINPKITVVYNGKLIGFCSSHCKELFLKNPKPFLVKLGLTAALK